jgi:hypothetical protein
VVNLPGPFDTTAVLVAVIAGGVEVVLRGVRVGILEGGKQPTQRLLVVVDADSEVQVFVLEILRLVRHQYFEIAVKQLQPILFPLQIHASLLHSTVCAEPPRSTQGFLVWLLLARSFLAPSFFLHRSCNLL